METVGDYAIVVGICLVISTISTATVCWICSHRKPLTSEE